jgi:flagellar basal-body rod protein FlgG
MNVSLYQAAAAMNANSQWLDVISDNLASSSVPGYRKQSLSTAAVQAGLLPVGGLNSSGSPQSFSVPKTSVSTSFKSGDMNYTGDDKNVGIDGQGFFQVQLPNGSTAVTRDGEFQVNASGRLVTKEGYLVKGKLGPIQLDVHNSAPLSISAAGEVFQGEEVKDSLSLTDFKNPELLTQTNGVYFLATNPGLITQPATGSLREGYVEGANTSSLGEMANMMTAMRTFEANEHVVQIQNDRLGKVISDLGNPSSS